MGVPNSEVGYTSAMPRREDHEVRKGHDGHWIKKKSIYSKNTDIEYFKQVICSPIFPLQNEVCFINLTYLVPVLFKFYIQGVLN